MKAIPKIEEFTANGFAVDWIRYAEALQQWADEQEAKYNALAKISDMQEKDIRELKEFKTLVKARMEQDFEGHSNFKADIYKLLNKH